MLCWTAAAVTSAFSPPVQLSIRSVPNSSPRAALDVLRCSAAEELGSFHTWLEEKGVSTSAVNGKRLPGFGLSLTVGETGIKKGDKLLVVPSSLHITPSATAASPLGQAVSEVVASDDVASLLALGLLQEVGKGAASSAAPYVEMLPGMDGMAGVPLLYGDEELSKLFGGSHLVNMVQSERNQLIAQWQAIETTVMPKYDESLFPRDTFNVGGFLWAHAIVLTRALPFGDELSLIPFLDLANHQSGAPNTCSIGMVEKGKDGEGDDRVIPVADPLQLEGKEGAAVLTAGVDLEPGAQVFIDYGEAGWRSSWEMLYTYGFVPGEKSEEWLAAGGRPIFFDGISESDAMYQQKRAVLDALAGGEDESFWAGMWVDLKADPSSCVAMAPLLRLSKLSSDETSAELKPFAERLASWQAEPMETWTRLQSPLDERTEKLVAEQVIAQCEEALTQLPPVETLIKTSEPAAEGAEPDDGRARMAARVLLGERNALEACINVWKREAAAVAAAAEAN